MMRMIRYIDNGDGGDDNLSVDYVLKRSKNEQMGLENDKTKWNEWQRYRLHQLHFPGNEVGIIRSRAGSCAICAAGYAAGFLDRASDCGAAFLFGFSDSLPFFLGRLFTVFCVVSFCSANKS